MRAPMCQWMTDRNLSPAKKGFDKTSWHMLRPLFFIFFFAQLSSQLSCIDKDDVSPPPVSVKCMMMGRNDKKGWTEPKKRGHATTPLCDAFFSTNFSTTAESRGHDDGTLRYSSPVYVTLFLFTWPVLGYPLHFFFILTNFEARCSRQALQL